MNTSYTNEKDLTTFYIKRVYKGRWQIVRRLYTLRPPSSKFFDIADRKVMIV
jgi:hypothetical protein